MTSSCLPSSLISIQALEKSINAGSPSFRVASLSFARLDKNCDCSLAAFPFCKQNYMTEPHDLAVCFEGYGSYFSRVMRHILARIFTSVASKNASRIAA